MNSRVPLPFVSMHRALKKAYVPRRDLSHPSPLSTAYPCFIIFPWQAPLSQDEGGIHASTEEGIREVRLEEEGPRSEARREEGREADPREADPREGAAEGSGGPAERHRPLEPAHGLHDPPARRREALLYRPPRL